MAWAAAAKQAGSVTDYKAVAKVLRNTPYKGIGGTYDFDNSYQAASQGDHLLPVNLFQAKGGEFHSSHAFLCMR